MPSDGSLYWADLHIHSALSPCADNSMTPGAIVAQAKNKGLSIIALTDHNSALNCPAIMNYSNDTLLIIPGMEIQTKEEVHLVCLFGEIETALGWHQFVTERLKKQPNQIKYFGNQYIFDSAEEISREEENLLLTSTDLGFNDVFQAVKRFGGVAIPAHIDRPSYSVLANLGFLPESLNLRIIEISHHMSQSQFLQKYPRFADSMLIQSSDAHRLTEIGQGQTSFFLPELSWEAMKKILFQNS